MALLRFSVPMIIDSLLYVSLLKFMDPFLRLEDFHHSQAQYGRHFVASLFELAVAETACRILSKP